MRGRRSSCSRPSPSDTSSPPIGRYPRKPCVRAHFGRLGNSRSAARYHETPKRNAHLAPQVILFLSCPTAVSIKDTCTTRPLIGGVADNVGAATRRSIARVTGDDTDRGRRRRDPSGPRGRPPKDASAREVTRLEAIARMRGEVLALRERRLHVAGDRRDGVEQGLSRDGGDAQHRAVEEGRRSTAPRPRDRRARGGERPGCRIAARSQPWGARRVACREGGAAPSSRRPLKRRRKARADRSRSRTCNRAGSWCAKTARFEGALHGTEHLLGGWREGRRGQIHGQHGAARLPAGQGRSHAVRGVGHQQPGRLQGVSGGASV